MIPLENSYPMGGVEELVRDLVEVFIDGFGGLRFSGGDPRAGIGDGRVPAEHIVVGDTGVNGGRLPHFANSATLVRLLDLWVPLFPLPCLHVIWKHIFN